MSPPHLVIVGPTGSGKSALAIDIAESLRERRGEVVEIISVDSMQVYRRMDIGTATPGADELGRVRHHLVNCLEPSDEGSVAWFQHEAATVRADLESRDGRALFVGGTGLYHRSVVDGLAIPGQYPEVAATIDDPTVATEQLHERLAALDLDAAQKMESTNRRRVLRALEVTIGSGRPFSTFGPGLEHYPESAMRMIGLSVPRDRLGPLLRARIDDQLARGFVAEVATLLAERPALSRTARQALGYRELIEHLEGRASLDEAVELIAVRTRQFAVRQDRWFRRDPRIVWFDAETVTAEAVLAGTLEAT